MRRISVPIKVVARSLGFEISRYRPASPAQPGSAARPIADLRSFLEDVRARGLQPRRILDVGANVGQWTRLAQQVFPEAAFLLIEPLQEMRDELNSLCAADPKVAWVEAGVGALEEEATLTVWNDFVGSTFVVQPDATLLATGKQRSMLLRTIDGIVAEHGFRGPELVKLDIQGFELEALKGATTLFGTTELFILEVSLFPFGAAMPILADVVEFMGSRSYETYDIAGALRRPSDGALAQLDIAFAKRDGALRSSNAW